MVYSEYNKNKSKVEKPDYLKFIDLLIYCNKNTNSGADVFIVQSDIDKICNKTTLVKYLTNLRRKKIIENFTNGEPYKEGSENKIKGIYVRCILEHKEIRKWKNGLHVPGESGLEISNDGHIIERFGHPGKGFQFDDRDAYVLNCLYENRNSPTPTNEIINNSNGKITNSGQIVTSINNFKHRLKKPLGFEDSEIKRIFPRGSKGTYKIIL